MSGGEFPPPMPPDLAREFKRLRRGRNIAIMLTLVGICILFYVIAMVKLASHGGGA